MSEIRERLELEYKNDAELKDKPQNQASLYAYLWSLYPNIHERCASIVAHLSIMFGLAMFVLKEASLTSPPIIMAATLDVVLYLVLLILSLRTIRSFGLNESITSTDSYVDKFFDELTLKFSLLGLMNSLTVVGMIYSVLLVVVILSAR
jgi:hypothetical protein